MPLLLILFIAIPLAEIATFIQIGGIIGLWPTLGTVVVTALIGSALLRQQGLAALSRVQAAVNRNVFPGDALFDGACLILAGALLLTPGFLTDAVGFALFVPGVRQALGSMILKNVMVRMSQSGVRYGRAGGPGGAPGDTVDGDYEDITPSTPMAGEDRGLTTQTASPTESPPKS